MVPLVAALISYAVSVHFDEFAQGEILYLIVRRFIAFADHLIDLVLDPGAQSYKVPHRKTVRVALSPAYKPCLGRLLRLEMEPSQVAQEPRREYLFPVLGDELVVHHGFFLVVIHLVHPFHAEPVYKSRGKGFSSRVIRGVHRGKKAETPAYPVDVLLLQMSFRFFQSLGHRHIPGAGDPAGFFAKAFFIYFGHDPCLVIMFGYLQLPAVQKGIEPLQYLGFGQVYLVQHQPVPLLHGFYKYPVLPYKIAYFGVVAVAAYEFRFFRQSVKVEPPEAVVGKVSQVPYKGCLSDGGLSHQEDRVVQKNGDGYFLEVPHRGNRRDKPGGLDGRNVRFYPVMMDRKRHVVDHYVVAFFSYGAAPHDAFYL